MTARQLAKGEWKFRVASKIHFILAGLANCKSKQVTDFIAWPSRCHDAILIMQLFYD
jgi:hypothetical protein